MCKNQFGCMACFLQYGPGVGSTTLLLSTRTLQSPYNCMYGEVLSEFVAPDNGGRVGKRLCWTIFNDEGYPRGATRLLYNPRRFAAKLGEASKYDGEYFAILDDAFGGTVQSIEFKEEFFECTGKINLPVDGDAALKMWEDNTEADLLSSLKHNKETVRVTKMM
jgi:hypothetical protein